MFRTVLASFALSSLVGCTAPVVLTPDEESSAPSEPEAPVHATPIALGRCGAEEIANVSGASSVHDLAFAESRLAWIGDAGVHVLDLDTRFVELHNEAARHVAAFRTDLVWSTAAVAMNKTDFAYVRRYEGKAAQLFRVSRAAGGTSELANGALADAVATDSTNIWYGVQSTDDSGTSTSFRRMPLGGGPHFSYAEVPGVAVKMSANDLHAIALLNGDVSRLAQLWPNNATPRVLFQGRIRDFATIDADVYFTMGTSIVRVDREGRFDHAFDSSCEIGAITASRDSIYFTAWNDAGGAIFRVARQPER